MGLSIRLDAEETAATLQRFLADYVRHSGAAGVVVGLSGGLDSAVVAALATRALGTERVHAFALPSARSADEDLAHARLLADRLHISLATHHIQGLVDAAAEVLGPEATADRALVANVMARSRMAVLYAEAQRHHALVLGTGNKSELLTGYFTKHGDGGVDLLPIGDLYKTQVRLLAAHLDIPREIIDKPPSAGLWPGQTDADELGLEYATLDRILLGLEIALPPERIAADAGVDVAEVRRVETLRTRSQHKRSTPLICKLGIRTIGTDWRDPVMGADPEAA